MLLIREALSGEECVSRGWSRSEGEITNTLFPYPVIHRTRFLSMNRFVGLNPCIGLNRNIVAFPKRHATAVRSDGVC